MNKQDITTFSDNIFFIFCTSRYLYLNFFSKNIYSRVAFGPNKDFWHVFSCARGEGSIWPFSERIQFASSNRNNTIGGACESFALLVAVFTPYVMLDKFNCIINTFVFLTKFVKIYLVILWNIRSQTKSVAIRGASRYSNGTACLCN